MNTDETDRNPFIRVREVISCCPNAGYWNDMAPVLKRTYFMPYWSEARLRRHLDMLKAFGFNSIQVTAAGQVAHNSGVSQEDWQEKLILYCRMAREIGMDVSQFVWGSCFYDPAENAYIRNLDWHRAADRKRIEQFYAGEAFLAPHVGRVITHWLDPGGPGCEKCTIDTVVDMHNALITAFRAANPRVRGALSTWFMQPGKKWPGYEGPGALAVHPRLDRDTDIVLGLMNTGADGDNLDWAGELKAGDLEEIAAAGRRAGVWGWYTTDRECHPAIHVRTDVLQNYFRHLPPLVRTGLDWHSVDDNCHGLNMQNLYVAGKLMRDPSLDACELLEEFARGFVGEGPAPAVTAALHAIELARTRSMLYSARFEDDSSPPEEWEKNRRPLPVSWIEDASVAVDAAVAGMRHITLDPAFTPAWPVTLEPAIYIEELNAHLAAIRRMLTFIADIRKVEKMRNAGARADTIRDAVEALPAVTYDPAHTAGLETDVWRKKLARLDRPADST